MRCRACGEEEDDGQHFRCAPPSVEPKPAATPPAESRVRKSYLGDGAFAEFDGYGIMLTAENGVAVTDRVYLEPAVYRALVRFVESLKPASGAVSNG